MKFGIALLALSAGLYAQTAAYTPQRTPEGLPDLEGLWQPQTNGAAYSILPHPPGFLLGAGSKVGIVEGGVHELRVGRDAVCTGVLLIRPTLTTL